MQITPQEAVAQILPTSKTQFTKNNFSTQNTRRVSEKDYQKTLRHAAVQFHSSKIDHRYEVSTAIGTFWIERTSLDIVYLAFCYAVSTDFCTKTFHYFGRQFEELRNATRYHLLDDACELNYYKVKWYTILNQQLIRCGHYRKIILETILSHNNVIQEQPIKGEAWKVKLSWKCVQ